MRNIKVMITGADDGVSIEELKLLSFKYPFVEWGVLRGSVDREGTPRYPSLDWYEKFCEMLIENPEVFGVAHLCGRRARQAGAFTGILKSVQLNLAGEIGDEDEFCTWVQTCKVPVIVQVPSMQHASDIELSFVSRYAHSPRRLGYLVDASGGTGRWDQTRWQPPHEALRRVGYAGGIGPDNVVAALSTVWSVVNAHDCAAQHGKVWIDMESGVRTNDRFDLTKVEAVLSQAERWRSQG
jgi:phosphoribosylanthranilate isomerase